MTTAAQNSKQILAQKGTAATPSFSFLGGNFTGMYLAGTNQLGFSTAGVNAVTIDASQNVTISNSLIIGNLVTPTIVGGTTASSTLTLQSTSGVGTSDSISLKVGNNGATTAMYINTSGNVGFGTVSPSANARVQIASTLLTSGGNSRGVSVSALIPSGTTTAATAFEGVLSTDASSFTLTALRYFRATQSTIGSGSIVTNQYGFLAEPTLTGATNNYGFYSGIDSGTGRYNFYASGTADNYFAGNVSVGTTSTAGRLNVTGGTIEFDPGAGADATRAFNFNINTTNYGKILIPSGSGGAMAFWTGGSGLVQERMRIDSSGNVGIGTASPGAPLNIYSATSASMVLQGDATTQYNIGRYSTDTSSSIISIRKYRGSVASPTAVASGDLSGTINFAAFGGTNLRNVAYIVGAVETYTSDTNITGILRFGTSPSGSASPTERVRIDASGNVGIGSTSPSSAGGTLNLLVSSAGTTIIKSNTSSTTATARFDYGTGTANSYVISALNDNSGSPYYQLSAGSAVTTSYTDFTTQIWRNTPGTTEYMRLISTGNLGIGTALPAYPLQVVRDQAATTSIAVNNSNASWDANFIANSGANSMLVGSAGSSYGGYHGIVASGGYVFSTGSAGLQLIADAAAPIELCTNAGIKRMTIASNGNIGINTTSVGGGVFVVAIANATTVPTTNPTGGGILYVDGGALKYRGSSGTVTTIANA